MKAGKNEEDNGPIKLLKHLIATLKKCACVCAHMCMHTSYSHILYCKNKASSENNLPPNESNDRKLDSEMQQAPYHN